MNIYWPLPISKKVNILVSATPRNFSFFAAKNLKKLFFSCVDCKWYCSPEWNQSLIAQPIMLRIVPFSLRLLLRQSSHYDHPNTSNWNNIRQMCRNKCVIEWALLPAVHYNIDAMFYRLLQIRCAKRAIHHSDHLVAGQCSKISQIDYIQCRIARSLCPTHLKAKIIQIRMQDTSYSQLS